MNESKGVLAPRQIINNGDQAKLLLLGTFHFRDAGLDEYKPQYDVNIMSEEKQEELSEVVQLLGQFRPTRVAVERKVPRQEELSREYRSYLSGNFALPPSEVYQLGFRLAAQAGHKDLYAIDVLGRQYDLLEVVRNRAVEYGQEHLLQALQTKWGQAYTRLYQCDDELKTRQTLREHLVYLNSEERLIVGHGHYLVDLFRLGCRDDYTGADYVCGWWYDRNLRIFNNIQRITSSSLDRILVLIGAGHVPILRHCAQASPEYELTDVADYLG